ncbi:male-enhanced antigen 1 [Danaus plexippus]|uniref:Male-enhanced antigen 1 n=1 Tax=Danaus plexippus plexippus TaxID=278856 RepID=A0A212F3H6_DANPL|nr:male-enhanced antigen 1 [Danaus plexippus]OWR48285.1 hypothetical protein KGM_208543 [Danaus plexippus plexippus]
MVCEGPDPPDNSSQDIIPPSRHDLITNGHEDSDDEQNEHFGYEPLPQGPEAVLSDHDSDNENDTVEVQAPVNNIPQIEPMESALTREVWSMPRPNDTIQMDSERVQQVMSIMANFALPQASIPEWAQSVSEDQWRQTLNDRLEKLQGNP